MLELDDIQHFLLTRPRAMAARYGFLRYRQPDHGRAWLAGIIDRVGTGRAMSGADQPDARWVTVAFTWNGLRALGVDDASPGDIPRGVPTRHGRAGGNTGRHGHEPSG